MTDVDGKTIPISFLLFENGITHRIFITFDEIICFNCKSTHHEAEECNVFSDTIEPFNNLTIPPQPKKSNPHVKNIPELAFSSVPPFDADTSKI